VNGEHTPTHRDIYPRPPALLFQCRKDFYPYQQCQQGAKDKFSRGLQYGLSWVQGRSGQEYWYGPQDRRLYAAPQRPHTQKYVFWHPNRWLKRASLTGRTILHHSALILQGGQSAVLNNVAMSRGNPRSQICVLALGLRCARRLWKVFVGPHEYRR